MERLLSVKDIMARYQCSRQTASKRIHEMPHIEDPLMVTEKAVMEWESRRLVLPSDEIMRQKLKRRMKEIKKRGQTR